MTMDHDASGRSDGSHGGSNAGANPPFDDDATPLPPEPVRRQPRALMAFVGLAVVVLVAGLAVWVSSGGADDEVTSASVPPSPTVGTTVPGSVATPSTAAATAPPTTAPPTTPSTMPASTAPPTTAPPTTAPPAFTLPEPGAETWTVPSDYAPVAPEMTLDLATTSGEVRVYDGVVDQLRCVGVVGPGDAVTTWCGPPNLATSFVADRGLEPVVVELGAAAGSATVQVPQVGWTLGSNGCSDPLATILGGVDPGALPVTGVIRRGDEAFLGIGASFFGPGIAPDGGGILAARRDEGWVVLDFGT